MRINREDYIIERDYRKKRLEEFQEAIQENLRGVSTEIISELVDERERQNLTQKDVLAGSEDKTSHLYRKESYVQGNDELQFEQEINVSVGLEIV